MKIYLKRDTAFENSRYIVCDELGKQLYTVSGKHGTNSERMYIMQGENCISKIRNTSLALLRSCYVATGSGNFHMVITCSKDKIAITYHGIGFHIRGNVLEKSYDILDVDNTLIACVQKRFNTHNEVLEININNDRYELYCIASALCLNTVCTNDALSLQTT